MAWIFSAGWRSRVSVCVWCVCPGEGQFVTSFARNTVWVAKRNHRELSQGCPCMFTRWWRNRFPWQLPYRLTLFPLRVLHALGGQLQGWILHLYESVSKNNLLLWRRLVLWIGWFFLFFFPPSVFLSVCLSFLVLTQINPWLEFLDGSFLGFFRSPCI